MTHLRHATIHRGLSVTRAGMVMIALLAGGCSSSRPNDDGDTHNTSASTSGFGMQMHVFTCEDGSSILTGLSADSFVVDLVGAERGNREQLTVPLSRVHTANQRLTVTIGKDQLHLEPIGKQGINEHLSFRGKSCWR